MHPEFADWYLVAAIDAKDTNLKARWAGVETFAKVAKPPDILDAGRFFYGIEPKASDFEKRLRSAFKEADEAFLMHGNTAEVQVLAGATLGAILASDNEELATTAALTLTCGAFRDRRRPPVGDIVRLARESVSTRSARLRDRPTTPLPASRKVIAEGAKKLDILQKALQANGAVNSLVDPIATIVGDLQRQLSDLIAWAHAQDRQQALRREESDVLWWLFGGRSRDLDLAFADVPAPMIALLAGKEMADLTGAMPGPYSARAFLGKAVRDGLGAAAGSPTTLSAAFKACPAQWRRTVAMQPEVPTVEDLCPLLLGLRKVAEAGEDAGLVVFERITGFNVEEKHDPIDLAEQSYEEWLLARLVRGQAS